MPFYDFIVKFQKLDLVDLFTLFWKKDESQIDFDVLKTLVVTLLIVSEWVKDIL